MSGIHDPNIGDDAPAPEVREECGADLPVAHRASRDNDRVEVGR
jgi:hypothetical protein